MDEELFDWNWTGHFEQWVKRMMAFADDVTQPAATREKATGVIADAHARLSNLPKEMSSDNFGKAFAILYQAGRDFDAFVKPPPIPIDTVIEVKPMSSYSLLRTAPEEPEAIFVD